MRDLSRRWHERAAEDPEIRMIEGGERVFRRVVTIHTALRQNTQRRVNGARFISRVSPPRSTSYAGFWLLIGLFAPRPPFSLPSSIADALQGRLAQGLRRYGGTTPNRLHPCLLHPSAAKERDLILLAVCKKNAIDDDQYEAHFVFYTKAVFGGGGSGPISVSGDEVRMGICPVS